MELSDDQLFEILDDWNYWNKTPKDLGIQRSYIKTIESLLRLKEVIVIDGVRRSGKTTALRQLMNKLKANFLYINFDDYRLYSYYSINLLERIINIYRQKVNPKDKAIIIFDEIQNIKGWEKFIRTKYDLEENLKFIVTGSNAALISKEFASLLTGRIVRINFFPFDFKEYLELKNVHVASGSYQSLRHDRDIYLNHFENYLQEGGFPEYLKEKNREVLSNYFQDIISKDIVSRFNIRDKNTLDNMALDFATNISNILNMKQTAKTLGVSLNTLKKYMSYLEQAKLFFYMKYFSYSVKVQNRMNRKVYMIDNGIRNIVSFKFSRDLGKLAENFVFLQLLREGYTPYYWNKTNEVDFIAIKGDEKIAINVSYTNKLEEREYQGLIEFSKEHKIDRLIILSKDINETRIVKEKTIKIIPLWYFAINAEL